MRAGKNCACKSETGLNRKIADCEKGMVAGMNLIERNCPGCRKKSCDGCSLGVSIGLNKGKPQLFPSDFMAEKQSGYGISFDIGTTTLAGMLWCLETGRFLAVETDGNPQRKFGRDVISRLAYAKAGEENRQELQKILVDKLDEMAQKLWRAYCLKEAGKVCQTEATEEETSAHGIVRVTAVGNTAMCEILAGCELTGLFGAPFQKAYKGSLCQTGRTLGFRALAKAMITVLPSIEGFVGSDALGVYTWVRHQKKEAPVLAVDLGTNGEILLIGAEKTYACSAAAGPALEGGAVCQGMQAAAGAIEDIKLRGSFPGQDIICKIIGEAGPRGICGSGLIAALALLRELGVIDREGCLLGEEEARKKGVPERICRRISRETGENRILLTNEEAPVYLTAGDIRQLQLAKGAIRAGIEILLKKAGYRKEQLKQIYLAGAFGSYIKIEAAAAIGLLPEVRPQTLIQAGNCAGTGAAMALLSPAVEKEMEKSAENIVHIELAEEANFQPLFLKALQFQ